MIQTLQICQVQSIFFRGGGLFSLDPGRKGRSNVKTLQKSHLTGVIGKLSYRIGFKARRSFFFTNGWGFIRIVETSTEEIRSNGQNLDNYEIVETPILANRWMLLIGWLKATEMCLTFYISPLRKDESKKYNKKFRGYTHFGPSKGGASQHCVWPTFFSFSTLKLGMLAKNNKKNRA